MERRKLGRGCENEIRVQEDKNRMMKTNEDRNVIGVLGGCLEFSESNGNALEVLGDCSELRGLVSVVSESWRMVGMESGEW